MKYTITFTLLLLASSLVTAAERSGTERQKAPARAGMSSCEGSDYQSFTLEEAKKFHKLFDYPFTAWTQGGDFTRYVFLNMSEFWGHIVLNRKGRTRELRVDHQEAIADFVAGGEEGEKKLAEYVRNSPVDGAIVVHEGRIVFEDYPRMRPNDKHIWFSVSKTFVSTALAILEDRGRIDVGKPIDTYLEMLSGTAWEGIRVIDILDMASGIDCPEVHEDADSCFWGFYDAFGWPMAARVQDDPMETVRKMGTLRPAGEVFDYTSVNTEVLNRLVETVSGERFSDFVEREIWQRTGAESDALIATTPNGDAMSAGGVSTNLRDLARYGMLFTPSGRGGSAPAVSDAYLDKIQNGGRPQLTSAEGRRRRQAQLGDDSFRHNSFQWDIVTSDGDFYKGGSGGQGLYISPSNDVVVAWFGTHTEEGKRNEMLRIARQLATSGFFDD